MNLSKSFISAFVIVAAVILVVGGFFTLGGIVNTSQSVPPGLYRKVDKPLGLGKIVVFCPPNRPDFQEALKRGYIQPGSCPDGFGSVMLKVAAKRKNIVTINENGVSVNDTLLPESKPLSKDKEDRPMPVIVLDRYELKDNEVLLMSGSTGEPYDGRYFGIIEADQISSVIVPLF